MSAVSNALAWAVVLGFTAAAILEFAGRQRPARAVAGASWGAFAVFWLVLFPKFAFGMRSFVEGALSLAAVPLCLHAGYLVVRGRDSLLVLSRAVAFMGLIYLPVATLPVVRRTLVELVAAQAYAGITLLGYDPAFTTGPELGYHNRFVFESGGRTLSTYIVVACTGIGSISIFGGLLASVRAPLRRRLGAAAFAVAVIWALNLVRNVFISVAYGDQWFQHDLLVSVVVPAIYTEPYLTSYFVADRVISQVLSVVALVGITLVVVRRVPELLDVLEEAVYVCTRREYDLADALRVGDDSADGPIDGEVTAGDD